MVPAASTLRMRVHTLKGPPACRVPPAAPDADVAPATDDLVPELFVAQFASSTLTWRQLGASITQEAGERGRGGREGGRGGCAHC